MEVDDISKEWPDESNFENFTDAEFNNILQDDKDLQHFIANIDIGQDVGINDNMLFNPVSLNSVQGFDDQQRFSTSDSSLGEQYSPSTTSFSSLNQFGDQYSPSTGSVDSGLPNDFNDSPLLSPDSLSLDYPNAGISDLPQTDPNTGISSELVRLIQQQVQQALIQQQQQQIQQQEVQQNYQQRITLLQQQKILNQCNGHQLTQQDITESKNDSQLRKMLMQTKNNIAQTKNTIMNSLQDKKEKIQKVFPKPGNIIPKPGIIKPGKRKIHGLPNQDEVKVEKIPALLGSVPHFAAVISSEQDTTGSLEALLQQNKPQTISDLDQNAIVSNFQATKLDVKNVSSTVPITATYTIPSSVQQNNSNNKISVSRLKTPPSFPPKQPQQLSHKGRHRLSSSESKKVKGAESKKSRVEHVIIEKRYRMKITDSLNELKNMLPGADDKKATKNTILQAAIEEIKRLKKQNDTLRRRFDKMRKVFEDLKNIGILTSSQCLTTSSSSESEEYTSSENTMSSASDSTGSGASFEPEVNQDHYASPFQRQSARDGVKSLTCLTLFLFLFLNPLNWLVTSGKASLPNDGKTFTSRHLLSSREPEHSPEFSLVSSLVNIFMSLFILMIMVLRGNPKCKKSSKLAQCFNSQYKKAQKKINKHDFDAAKGSLRIALFLIGNSCPKTFYGQLASFSWKCICHMLYQLGVLTTLKSIGHAILPPAICLSTEKEEREFAAKMSAKAYKKLHEISLKDPSSTYLESACYIMNAIYAAEVSCDKEMLCTMYATAVVHMRERLWSRISSFPQYYFTACAHHVSLASKEGPFAIDWIFESRGYEFFSGDLWDINRRTVFNIEHEESSLNENDLLQIAFVQFQEHLLSKALKRIVTPNGSYPNEGKIELRQRSLSYLEGLGSGPMSEQVDAISVHYQTLYAWWGNTLKQLLEVFKHGSVEHDELMMMCSMFNEIHEQHRHPLVSLADAAVSSYIYIRNMKEAVWKQEIAASDLEDQRLNVQEKLECASELIDSLRSNVSGADGSDQEIEELIFIMCCGLVIDSHFLLWQYDSSCLASERDLNFLVNENNILHTYAMKYPELTAKVQLHEKDIQCMSGDNNAELTRIMKRTEYVKTVSLHESNVNGMYFDFEAECK